MLLFLVSTLHVKWNMFCLTYLLISCLPESEFLSGIPIYVKEFEQNNRIVHGSKFGTVLLMRFAQQLYLHMYSAV